MNTSPITSRCTAGRRRPLWPRRASSNSTQWGLPPNAVFVDAEAHCSAVRLDQALMSARQRAVAIARAIVTFEVELPAIGARSEPTGTIAQRATLVLSLDDVIGAIPLRARTRARSGRCRYSRSVRRRRCAGRSVPSCQSPSRNDRLPRCRAPRGIRMRSCALWPRVFSGPARGGLGAGRSPGTGNVAGAGGVSGTGSGRGLGAGGGGGGVGADDASGAGARTGKGALAGGASGGSCTTAGASGIVGAGGGPSRSDQSTATRAGAQRRRPQRQRTQAAARVRRRADGRYRGDRDYQRRYGRNACR